MAVTKIGKYDVVRVLGSGAMGVVYEGVDPVIGRKVAIKTIRFEVLTAPFERDDAQKRFLREAQAAGSLSHPSIVTIYEVGEENGLAYIAMEHIDGQSLESLLAGHTRLPLDRIVALVTQIADALDYAHRHGIVHRDIKPGNILVDVDGRARIVDFGIARVASSSLTQTNAVLGTPYYMSPEQVAGRTVDHRADLFSLGAVLYEMLTLAKPFPGDGLTTVIYRIVNEDPRSPREFDQNLPRGLDTIVATALAKDPARRYQSGRALADDLANYRRFEGTEATRPATVPQPSGRAVAAAATAAASHTTSDDRRRRLLLAVVAGMMVLVVLVVAVVLNLSRTKPRTVRTGAAAANSDAATASAPMPETSATRAPSSAQAAAVATALPAAASVQPPKGAAAPPTVAAGGPAAAPSSERGRSRSSVKGRVYEAADVDRGPRVLKQVAPTYPPGAARRRLQDVIVLKALIDVAGRVADVRIIKGSAKDHSFDAAAVDAVRQWSFAPARKAGQPVACWLNVGVPFQLPR
jgi:eukaryotic-like serine/threonine-protein kinase